MIVRLPWPDPKLMPNRSKGRAWQAASKLRAEQRAAGAMCTKAALEITGPSTFPDGNIPLSLVYMAPDRRHRDLDNLLSGSKALIDGMAQELGINDARFRPIYVDCVYAGGEGCVMAAVGIEMVQGVCK